jgi:hypothetical protein
MLKSFVAALALAVGVGGQAPPQPPPREPSKPPPFVLGVLYHEGGVVPELSRLDPLTLKQTGRAIRLRLGGATATAFSPTGGKLALATVEPGIQLVDTGRLRRIGFVKLGGVGWVTSLSWQRGTLFAIVSGERGTTALVVDPTGRQVLQRHRLAGTFLAATATDGGVAFLTGPPRGIGPVQLSVFGGKGLESVTVAAISGGMRARNSEDGYSAEQVIPGLAVGAGHAFVVSSGSTVASVRLDNLDVVYHTLSRPVSLLGRFRNWLEPAASAKVVEGPQRKAIWLGDGLVAVTGFDYSGAAGEPAGLTLLDTADWSVREIDEEAGDALRVGDTLLAFGADRGLVGYDLLGRELFHLLDGKQLDLVETARGLLYALGRGERRVVVDAASGRILGRAKPGFVSIVGS